MVLPSIRFLRLRSQFLATYNLLSRLGGEPFVIDFWKNVNRQILSALGHIPAKDFLSIRILQDTMFVGDNPEWIKHEATFLKTRLGESFDDIVREDPIGKPRLLKTRGLSTTSANTLHHLYHLHYFAKQIRKSPSSIKSVVEWGGGYGNFAKLWWRTVNGKGTYYIIDTALFCTIQWLYLSSVLGSKSVHLLKGSSDKLKEGVINIIPLALLEKNIPSGELFVSTWGLSESSSDAQDYVRKHKWFGSKHILLGFQESTNDLYNASRLGSLAKKDGVKISEIPFIKGNYYGIK